MRYWAFIIIYGMYGNLFGAYITQKNIGLARALKETPLAINSDKGEKKTFPLLELIMGYTIDPLWVSAGQCNLMSSYTRIHCNANKELSESRADHIIIELNSIYVWGDCHTTRITIPERYYFDITELQKSCDLRVLLGPTIHSQCGNATIHTSYGGIVLSERNPENAYRQLLACNARLWLLRKIKDWLTTQSEWSIHNSYSL